MFQNQLNKCGNRNLESDFSISCDTTSDIDTTVLSTGSISMLLWKMTDVPLFSWDATNLITLLPFQIKNPISPSFFFKAYNLFPSSLSLSELAPEFIRDVLHCHAGGGNRLRGSDKRHLGSTCLYLADTCTGTSKKKKKR